MLAVMTSLLSLVSAGRVACPEDAVYCGGPMSKASLYWRLFRGVLENPRYYYFTLRQGWYKKVAKRLANNDLPPRGTFYPAKLDLRIVYGCNLRCKMCGQWGDTGT